MSWRAGRNINPLRGGVGLSSKRKLPKQIWQFTGGVASFSAVLELNKRKLYPAIPWTVQTLRDFLEKNPQETLRQKKSGKARQRQKQNKRDTKNMKAGQTKASRENRAKQSTFAAGPKPPSPIDPDHPFAVLATLKSRD